MVASTRNALGAGNSGGLQLASGCARGKAVAIGPTEAEVDTPPMEAVPETRRIGRPLPSRPLRKEAAPGRSGDFAQGARGESHQGRTGRRIAALTLRPVPERTSGNGAQVLDGAVGGRGAFASGSDATRTATILRHAIGVRSTTKPRLGLILQFDLQELSSGRGEQAR
jgi:hypothetical protein